MSITRYNIKKWLRMLTKKSTLHVNQGLGKQFSPCEIQGYYNDLTEKVTLQPELLYNERIPTVVSEKGETIVFPVAVFQYGLGAYDLYLITGKEEYRAKFQQCVKWAYENQEHNGAWNNFFFYYPDHPYSSMAQGEGASLLIRGYCCFKDQEYLNSAKKAIDYMLLSIDDGGTVEYRGDDVIFHEYTHRKPVLNGWIFSVFGLFDYVIVTHDEGEYSAKLKMSIKTLEEQLPQFNLPYWSKYDMDGRISSPFYHHLHIAQCKALYELTNNQMFRTIYMRWEKQESNPFYKSIAFLLKASQKIVDRI